ncbi:oligosaccharide flippase family protein [Seohaeicola zhoushanensis]|uniref:Lipopolysaccharide biosynthesis protein n=1 Tax=Seohaeicola zhoushanensis TaxID=1569283 RepID=A0A8J3M9Y5_9RHOB|nr:oligosaccharide flippase family protein [Seohaeicola zhoushanensis]GHF71708.1 lipopolysaccharide biosynthesis protein [Seohaeicola zhoushanensis]
MKFSFSWLTRDGLKARALRGSSLTVLQIGGSNVLRLASNLILTRILFPEAFGLMALVQTFLQGMKMLSDSGVTPSIIRSKNSDDADFLNTAWTVQVCRGLILWLLTCILALPAAGFFDEPMLAQILPVTGLSLLISGFTTTKGATAQRDMRLGLQTAISIGTQAMGIAITVLLAWWLENVWALVIGGLISTTSAVVLQHYLLPGMNNRFCWNRAAFNEIFSFGKFIFLSSALGFIMNQGDRLVLGKYLPLAEFGIYNIGAMLATLPFMVSKALNDAIVFPLFRHLPIAANPANRRKVFTARRLVLGASLAGNALLAFAGVPLVDLLYDQRYTMAGPVVVLMCLALVPQTIFFSYRAVFMAAGDSRSPFFFVVIGATAQVPLLLLAVQTMGTFGVILVPGLVTMLLSPLRVRLLRRHNGWDTRGDLLLGTFGFATTGAACLLYWDRIILLAG